MTGSTSPSLQAACPTARSGGPADDRQDPTAVALLLSEAADALQSDPEFARSCVSRALELLREGSATEPAPPASSQGGLADWQVRRAVAYIEANLESPIRVKDLAALTRLSASHFSRAFKQSLGVAPMTYVTRQRVQLAQRLLLTTEDSMCEISLACGMYDQAHLTRVFRRFVGDSPSAWRRRRAAGPPQHPSALRRASS